MGLGRRLPFAQAPTHPPPAVGRRRVEAAAARRRSGRVLAQPVLPAVDAADDMDAGDVHADRDAATSSKSTASTMPTRRPAMRAAARPAARGYRSGFCTSLSRSRVVSPSKMPRDPPAVPWRCDRHRRIAGQRAPQLQLGLEVVDLLLQRRVSGRPPSRPARWRRRSAPSLPVSVRCNSRPSPAPGQRGLGRQALAQQVFDRARHRRASITPR